MAVELSSPEVRAVGGFDELDGDPYRCTAGALDAALEEVGDAQFPPDLLNQERTPLVGKGRVAGDHEKVPNPRKPGGDGFDHAIGQVVLGRVPAHVLERQYRDGWAAERNGERGAHWRSGGGLRGAHVPDETEALAGDGADQPLRGAVVSHRLACRVDATGQR